MQECSICCIIGDLSVELLPTFDFLSFVECYSPERCKTIFGSYQFPFCVGRFFSRVCSAIRPLLPPLSVFVTALCVGSPLAINIKAVMSPFGLTVLLLIIGFHLSSFIAGYIITGFVFKDAPDVKALQRTLSFETGLTLSYIC